MINNSGWRLQWNNNYEWVIISMIIILVITMVNIIS
jgi:hypothetical protein